MKTRSASPELAQKRNPIRTMRIERIASLACYGTVDSLNPTITAANQWFERTFDGAS